MRISDWSSDVCSSDLDPAVHAVATDDTQVQNMTHVVFNTKPVDKVDVTARIAARPARTLIFVRTKHGADRLVKQLGHAGVAAGAIHGNLNQNQTGRAPRRATECQHR